MKEVKWGEPIKKAEFIFKREFMMMEHNYLCGVCKKESAVQDTNSGVLLPCWDCQKNFQVYKVNWVTKLLNRWIRV